LDIFDRLEEINPGTYLPKKATAFHSLAILYRHFNHFDKAVQSYQRCIEIRTLLSGEYPSVYEPDLGNAIHGLGKLYMEIQDYEKAAYTLFDAMVVFERLADRSSDYEFELSSVYQNLGACMFEFADRRVAKTAWENALSIRESLTEADPRLYERNLLDTIQNLAIWHMYEGDYTRSEQLFNEALSIKLRFRELHPDKYDRDVAEIRSNLGKLYMNADDLKKAEEAFTMSLHLFERAENAEGRAYQQEKEEIFRFFRKIYTEFGSSGPKVMFLQIQVKIYETLETFFSGEYITKLAGILSDLASEYTDLESWKEAEQVRLRAHVLFEKLIAEGHTGYGSSLAESLFWLAISYEKQQDLNAADKTYRHCQEMYGRLGFVDDPEINAKLANVLIYYGKFLISHGNSNLGKNYIERAKKIEGFEAF
jgi:tetratricopeptide (TPR) repeat protein